MTATEVILPKLGQTMEEGTIVEWLKREGDAVERGEALFAVESEKATLESESPASGVLRKILVPAGATVAVLTPVAIITGTMDEDVTGLGVPQLRVAGEGTEPAHAPALESGGVHPEVGPKASELGTGRLLASPRAKMRARELDVELERIAGTGEKGRIVEKDVLSYVESQPNATPPAREVAAELGVDLTTVVGTRVDDKITQEDVQAAHRAVLAASPAKPTTGRTAELPVAETSGPVPTSGRKRITAERMPMSVQAAARVTLVTEADSSALIELCTGLKDMITKEWGLAPGYMDLLAMSVARALREHSYMNARLSGGVIEQLARVNLGIVVDVEKGFLVPVLRDADKLGLRALSKRLRELVTRAREGKSLPDDLTGGTFTITDLGGFEVDAFTPLIDPLQTATLGVGRILDKPVAAEGEVVVRGMMTLSLAFDHRLVDGAPAARFLQRIRQLIENPCLLLG